MYRGPLYEALISAGASAEKAEAADAAVATYKGEDDLHRLGRKIRELRWMMSASLALSFVVFVKLLFR